MRSGNVSIVDAGSSETIQAAARKLSSPAKRFSIIQLDGPLTAERSAALRSAGVTLRGYLPRHAYICDIRHADIEKLAALSFVQHLGLFRDSWKLDPSLAVLMRQSGLDAQAVQRPEAGPVRNAYSAQRAALHAAGLCSAVAVTFSGVDLVEATEAMAGIDGIDVIGFSDAGDRCWFTLRAPFSALEALIALPVIQFVEDAPEGHLRNGETEPVVQSGNSTQTPIWDRGLHGEGEIIGLIDSTPDVDHCSFHDSEPIGPTHRKFVALRNASAPGLHGTHVAGTLAGDKGPVGEYTYRDGMAYAGKISFSLQGAVMIDPASFIDRLTDAHNDGARVHSNSWGDEQSTAYTIWCAQIDQFTYDHEDDVVVFAVTNQSSLESPENAKNVLAVGATKHYPDIQEHCSGGMGPTDDGRRKPEIFASGCSVWSSWSNTPCFMRADTGTSFACPAIAGAAALVRQYFLEGFYPYGAADDVNAVSPTGALVRAVLLNGSVDLALEPGYPTDLEGWGRLQLNRSLHFEGQDRRTVVRDIRNSEGMTTGQSQTMNFTAYGPATALQVTLVFTDPPAEVNSTEPVINNLDLKLVGPSGSEYWGNEFFNGYSATGGTADPLNTVEQALIRIPETGTYTVQVIGTEVNSPAPQGFALAVSGHVVEGAYDPPASWCDLDGDGDRDLGDYAGFQRCFGGDGVAYADGACAAYDGDADGDVDEADYIPFRDLVTGPVIQP